MVNNLRKHVSVKNASFHPNAFNNKSYKNGNTAQRILPDFISCIKDFSLRFSCEKISNGFTVIHARE